MGGDEGRQPTKSCLSAKNGCWVELVGVLTNLLFLRIFRLLVVYVDVLCYVMYFSV